LLDTREKNELYCTITRKKGKKEKERKDEKKYAP